MQKFRFLKRPTNYAKELSKGSHAQADAVYGINDILTEIRQKSLTEKEKGTDFERLMKLWFLTDPRYNNLERVWLWEEFPARKDFSGKDLGIDLVARTETGDYWAIQCKCYAKDTHIDKGAVDSFLANASRTFLEPETMRTREFSNLLWVQTTGKRWGANAEAAIQGLSKPFNRITLYDLEISAVDWKKLKAGLYGDEAQLPGKHPLPHQLAAMSRAYEYFVEQRNERGKLIMACGTGKTYTSLKMMEQMTDKQAFVLFLVPSIALLGQTLNAWMADKQDTLRAVCVCSDAKASRKQLFPENSERLQKQKNAPVRVIIGNPPYSVGQGSANDNAQNLKYPHLDKRIAETYAANPNATNKNSLYDSYIRAFRWASDRIAQCPDGGIVAFISNGSWIDGNAQDGMRKCLSEEFDKIYVYNLRGNARTSGELRRKEGGSVFGEGTRTPITITILVKKGKKNG